MNTNRRTFLKQSMVASGLIAMPSIITSCVKKANDKVNIGMIGTGNHAVRHNLVNLLEIDKCRIIAVCDVDKSRAKGTKGLIDKHYENKDCDVYFDFRELLERKDIDAVMISTPDHWHTTISMMAIQAGKHVICEKPTLTISEGRTLIDYVKGRGLQYQTSLEDRFYKQYHRLAQLARNGYLGDLEEIVVGIPEGWTIEKFKEMNIDMEPGEIPKELDYDMWQGPAPEAPYSPGRCHFHFRWIDTYSGGMLTDWGAHLFDTAFRSMDPKTIGNMRVHGHGVYYEGGLYNTAREVDLHYKFGNGIKMNVHAKYPEITCKGKDGWASVIQWNKPLTASSDDLLYAEFKPEDLKLPTGENEHADLVDAILEGRDVIHGPEDLHEVSKWSHVGNIAMKLEEAVEWDNTNEAFIDNDKANAMRSREQRDKWSAETLMGVKV